MVCLVVCLVLSQSVIIVYKAFCSCISSNSLAPSPNVCLSPCTKSPPYLTAKPNLSGHTPQREWSINSNALARTDPSALNQKLSTAYIHFNRPALTSDTTIPSTTPLQPSHPHMNMSFDTYTLYSLARSKLSSSHSRDQCSLHRWVLLRNSILSSSSLLQDTSVSEYPEANVEDEEEEAEEEVCSIVEVDTFMFPDAGHFVRTYSKDAEDSEAQWLNSLLETLAEDEDDDYPSDSEPHATTSPVDDDEEQSPSPTISPLSSLDDLQLSRYYPVSVPYPIEFSSFSSQFTPNYVFNSAFGFSASNSIPFHEPFPYHDADIEDSPVPEAIEDVSDDESDAPSTPSVYRSSSSLTLDPSASESSATGGSRLRHTSSYKTSTTLFPFELDPLPFREVASEYPSPVPF